MLFFGLVKGYIIRYALQLFVLGIILLGSLAVIFAVFGTGISISFPSLPSWVFDLTIQVFIGSFITVIPSMGLFLWYIWNNWIALHSLLPKTGDAGAHYISPGGWDELQVFELKGNELTKVSKEKLKEIRIKKAREGYEVLRYYPDKNIAIISPDGISPTEVRRGYVDKVDFILKKGKLKSDKYDRLRTNFSTMVYDEVQKRANRYIHRAEGLQIPEYDGMHERIDEELETRGLDEMVEETEEEIEQQVENQTGAEVPEDPDVPDDIESAIAGDSE